MLTTFKSISDDCSGDVFQKGVTTRFNTLDSSFTSLNSTVATLAKGSDAHHASRRGQGNPLARCRRA